MVDDEQLTRTKLWMPKGFDEEEGRPKLLRADPTLAPKCDSCGADSKDWITILSFDKVEVNLCAECELALLKLLVSEYERRFADKRLASVDAT